MPFGVLSNQSERMPSYKSPHTALAALLANPYSGISAMEITDSLVRGAIYSGAKKIEIQISSDEFRFSHDGPSIPISHIQSNWEREAETECLDLLSSFGLDVAQLLFFGNEIQVTSQGRLSRLNLAQVISGLPWDTEPFDGSGGMSIAAIGVEDPWAFAQGEEGGASIFRACPIPVFINGEEVERLEREENIYFVDVDGIDVFIDIGSVHRGFCLVWGGVVYTRPGVDSLVCLPRICDTTGPRMEIIREDGSGWYEKAKSAFQRAVSQVLMRVEAEKGHPFIVEEYFQPLTSFHPELLLYSEYLSTKVLVTTGKAILPIVPSGSPYSRSMLESIEHPFYCDVPQIDTTLAHLASVYRLMLGGSAVLVKPGHTLPELHWLRKRAMSLRRGNIRVHSSGNVITAPHLLSGQIKLRIADHVFLNLKDGEGVTTSHVINDWILAEEEPMTQIDRISIGNAPDQKLQVLHINRKCISLVLPKFPCKPGDRDILKQALREASVFTNARLEID